MSKTLALMSAETKAIVEAYRTRVEAETGARLSFAAAANALIILGSRAVKK
jgi:hypothetical protein